VSSKPNIIADRLQVPQHPTVVRLDDLQSGATSWISDSYFVTDEVKNHLHALITALGKETGIGIFLIGHFGSGKSHFLAYLIQQIGRDLLAETRPEPIYLSLVNFSAEHSLESIVSKQLKIKTTQDRREAFGKLQQRHPDGVLLILDELSEFLRSKARAADFTEDIRFLQFMGEWAQGNKFWVLAAMQEQIEHTGDLDHSLYRKIKDRYPLRFLLTTVHVRDLISQTLLAKKPGYDRDVAEMIKDLTQGLPADVVDLEVLAELYPLHPVTLELLEEVRDCFSQARGIVEFVVTQLRGHDERQIKPFLQRSWGELLTPDYIVDHFKDLLEIQPEFVPLSNQCLAWYRQHLDSLFDQPAQRKLAKQLIKLLILVYISPIRTSMQPGDAVYWLMFRATRLDADKNVEMVKRILDALVDKGRFVERNGNRYRLNLKENTQAELANHVQRARDELQGKAEQVFDLLCGLLDNQQFNPFVLPRNQWQSRSYRWHFHERQYQVCLDEPTENPQGGPDGGYAFNLIVGLPWQPLRIQPGCALLQPASLELSPQWLELAAMLKVLEQPLTNKAKKLLSGQVQERAALFHSEIKQAYQQSKLYYDGVKTDQNLMLDASKSFTELMEQVISRLLKKRYPSFERFAPSYGPLPTETRLSFLQQGLAQGLFSLEAGDATQLVQEAYLAPMGLVKRAGRNFVLPRSLDRHELVGILVKMLEHEPEPDIIYHHFAEPVYGLVADQVHCLLYLLLIQGEIDIVKGKHSMRDHYETLLDPRQYDRVVIANALGEQEIAALHALLDGLGLKVPGQNTVSAQREALDQLQAFATDNRRQLDNLAVRLPDSEQAFKQRLTSLAAQWRVLDQGDTIFQGWQQFLFEVESVKAFSDEINRLSGLPEQINHLLSELGRYQHIQTQFEQRDASLPGFEQPPSLEDPDAFKSWLRKTESRYHAWCEQYISEHDAWWARQEIECLLEWQPRRISASRHLGLAHDLANCEQTKKRLATRRCRHIDNLNYQPFCHCGFDGGRAPVDEDMAKLEQLKKSIEQQTKHFFQQKKVRQRVAQWQQEGIECNQATQDYVANKSASPEIQDLDLFDSYLDGVEVTQAIDADELLDYIGHKQWAPEKLGQAMQEWAHGFNQYASVRIEQRETSSDVALLQWITQQVLATGARLPDSLSARQHSIINEKIRPEWVQPGLWRCLDDLGFKSSAVARLLALVIDGTLSELPESGLSPSVEIARNIGSSIECDSPEELAIMSAQYYRKHELFLQSNPQAWLKHLDSMARHEFLSPVSDLEHYLADNPPRQWLVLDAFGLPLLAWIKDNLPQWLPGWEIDRVEFVKVSVKSTTDAFYRSLLDSEAAPVFAKINTIDDQLHERFLPFGDLQNVLAVEIPIALKRKLGVFQTDAPLMISGDHGFRISRDGKRYEHGGSSTLERVIPVIQMKPVAIP
jgi:hypothetical protein